MPIKPMIGSASKVLYQLSVIMNELAEDDAYLSDLIHARNLQGGELKTTLSRIVRERLDLPTR